VRRVLIGVLIGAILASGGWLAWYRIGQQNTETTLTPKVASGSATDVVPTHCIVNAAGNEAIAYGTFRRGWPGDRWASGGHGEVVFGIFTSSNARLGKGSAVYPVGTRDWTATAHLVTGLGAPHLCLVALTPQGP
jgi:hypothetical protein